MITLKRRDLRAAYDFLKRVAFHDMKLPARIVLCVRPMSKAWGYYYHPPHRIDIDTKVATGDRLLKTMAHEMVHAVLEQNAACDHHLHDENFKALAQIVCARMGWSERSF